MWNPRSRLGEEPLAESRVERELGGEHLERHVAAEAQLLGAIDGGHSAVTDDGIDAVAADRHVDVARNPPLHVLILTAPWAFVHVESEIATRRGTAGGKPGRARARGRAP